MDRLERNMEQMQQMHRDIMGEITALHVNIESLHDSVSQLHASMIEVRAAAQQDGENIRALARIAEAHERRLTDLEGGSAE